MSEYSKTMIAERAMGFPADHALKVDDVETIRGDASKHRHVAIEWEGGVLWLDMSDLGDHYCIDVRQFRDEEVAATGVFALQAGRRITLDTRNVPEGERATAHGWPATFMPVLLMDKHRPTTEPEPRWQRGNGES